MRILELGAQCANTVKFATARMSRANVGEGPTTGGHAAGKAGGQAEEHADRQVCEHAEN